MEDSTSVIHPSFGDVVPTSDKLLAEAKIVAGLAEATLHPNPKLDWTAWTADYAKVRDAIAETYPQWFKDFDTRSRTSPADFTAPNKARKRDFSDTKAAKRATFFAADASFRDGLRRRTRPSSSDDAKVKRPVQHHGLWLR